MKLPGMWLRHTVTVEAYLGDSGYAPQYGDPVVVRSFLEEMTRLVRARSCQKSRIALRHGVVTATPRALN